jgi:hypothetical protein
MGKKKEGKAVRGLTLPTPRVVAVVGKPGQPLPVMTATSVPGTTMKMSFRATEENIRDIGENIDRLATSSPGTLVTPTDATRSLIRRGAEAFRQDERDQQDEDQ